MANSLFIFVSSFSISLAHLSATQPPSEPLQENVVIITMPEKLIINGSNWQKPIVNAPITSIVFQNCSTIFRTPVAEIQISPCKIPASVFQNRKLTLSCYEYFTPSGPIYRLTVKEGPKLIMEAGSNERNVDLGIGEFRVRKGALSERVWSDPFYGYHSSVFLISPNDTKFHELWPGMAKDLSGKDGTWSFFYISGRGLPGDKMPPGTEHEPYEIDYVLFRK